MLKKEQEALQSNAASRSGTKKGEYIAQTRRARLQRMQLQTEVRSTGK